MSQLNLPHFEPTTKKWRTEKSKKTDILRSIGKQSGKCVKSVLGKKRKAIQREGFAKKGRF